MVFVRRVPVINTWEEIEDNVSREIERAFLGDITADDATHLAVQRTDEHIRLARHADQPLLRSISQLLAFVLLVSYYMNRK